MDILQELVKSLSEVIDRHLDDIELSILRVYSYYGSISLYKASMLAGFAVSTTYKKAKKLLELGFLRSDSLHTHRITVKGLLQCIAQKVDDAPFMINKIKLIWRIDAKFEELCSYLIVFARSLKKMCISLSQIDNIDDFRSTARYIFTPLMYYLLADTIGVRPLSDIISRILNVKSEIVKMCEKLIIKSFNDFFVIFTLRMLSIIAGSKSKAVILLYNGRNDIDIMDLCNNTIEEIKYRIKKFREKNIDICGID
ncbi:MAG: hypothetical protein GXO10_06480 [Crenarchaeota archaeon]|nr:hypothetical protein [Thermoproteota archaeon]